MSSVVVSFRVPRELKERMERLRGRVDWGEELRRFLEERLEELEAEEALEEVDELLEGVPELPEGTVAGWIRSDREQQEGR